MSTATIEVPASRAPSFRGVLITLLAVTLIALAFIAFVALPYFRLDETQFRGYWPRRGWLLLHIATGIVALLTGPMQLWLGITNRRLAVHRRLGIAYMSSVVVSSVAAFYLAFHTDVGVVFGAGLTALAVAWLLATGMAYAAVRRHLMDQHKEWMIRSYVVTTAFVTFRILFLILESAGIGSLNERLTIASWFCWAVPLLFTEAWLQGRKILAVRGV
jgi:Predicted membrane protein (DUF2306)